MKTRQRLQQQCSTLLTRLAHATADFVRGQDCEALHNIRVALRALRTLLPLFFRPSSKTDQQLLSTLKLLAKRSNQARDLEVLLALLGQHSAVNALKLQLVTEYAALHAHLLQQPLPIPQLRAQIQSRLKTSRHLKCSIALHTQKLQRQLAQQAGLINQNADLLAQLDAWHRLRIKVKRLRYLYEYAHHSTHLAQLDTLKSAQEALGELHDAQNLSRYHNVDFSPLLARAQQHAARLTEL